jgi:hypothetical protein
MAAKANSVISYPSPFKFGFFAGLGFCCASIVMSLICWMLVALIGIGTIAAFAISVADHVTSTSDASDPHRAAPPPTLARWATPPTANTSKRP